MTPSEKAAFDAGIRHAVTMAQLAAVTIEAREDGGTIRHHAAAAALHGFAQGLKDSIGDDPSASRADHVIRHDAPGEGGVLKSEETLADRRHAAVAAGYTGDACPSCHAFTMKRSGTCLVCDACGSTTGCS